MSDDGGTAPVVVAGVVSVRVACAVRRFPVLAGRSVRHREAIDIRLVGRGSRNCHRHAVSET